MKKLLPKLTPKQKKILDIVVTSIEVVIVLIAIIASAIIISNPTPSSATVSKGPVKLLPVVSSSMDGDYEDSFKKGDLVIAVAPKNVLGLKEGDIITFKGSVNGYDRLITHRIIEVIRDDDGNALTYITHGDANPADSTEEVNPFGVLAVYKNHLKGVGKSIEWLQTPKNFLLVIVLPLALLFIWNIIIFVRMIIQWKMEKAAENGTGAIDEEEIKRRAIEEYLASQNAENKNSENKAAEEEKEENKETAETVETETENTNETETTAEAENEAENAAETENINEAEKTEEEINVSEDSVDDSE